MRLHEAVATGLPFRRPDDSHGHWLKWNEVLGLFATVGATHEVHFQPDDFEVVTWEVKREPREFVVYLDPHDDSVCYCEPGRENLDMSSWWTKIRVREVIE